MKQARSQPEFLIKCLLKAMAYSQIIPAWDETVRNQADSNCWETKHGSREFSSLTGMGDKNWSIGPARERALTHTSGIQLQLQKGYALGVKRQSRKTPALMESKWCAYLLSAVQKKSKPFPKEDNTIQCYYNFICSISSVRLLCRVWLFATPWITAHQASLSITNSWSSLRLTSIESVMPSRHLILCRLLLLLPPIPPSITVFSNEWTLCMRWPKYWGFSFSIIPSKEIPGLISFRMDWLDLLAVQGTLKSPLQHHSSKASILWHSAFFTVQFSHPYMTTGKTTALTRWTFVGKVMSLLLTSNKDLCDYIELTYLI